MLIFAPVQTSAKTKVYLMKTFLTSLALLTVSGIVLAQDVVFHHEMTVNIDPATAQLGVKDTITIPGSAELSGLTFSLHENLTPKSLTDGVSSAA